MILSDTEYERMMESLCSAPMVVRRKACVKLLRHDSSVLSTPNLSMACDLMDSASPNIRERMKAVYGAEERTDLFRHLRFIKRQAWQDIRTGGVRRFFLIYEDTLPTTHRRANVCRVLTKSDEGMDDVHHIWFDYTYKTGEFGCKTSTSTQSQTPG